MYAYEYITLLAWISATITRARPMNINKLSYVNKLSGASSISSFLSVYSFILLFA